MDFSGIVPALSSLWEGILMTLRLVIPSAFGGVVLGTVLALVRLSYNKLLSNIAGFHANYFHSISLLLAITWLYFAMPFVLRWITGKDTPVRAFTPCLVTFMMLEATCYCEIIHIDIQTIPKGQMDAAQTLGMTYGQTIHLVILPQTFRRMILLLLRQNTILFQDTSLVYTVGLMDSLNSARSRGNIIDQVNEFLIFTGLIYSVISLTAPFAVKRLQKGLTVWFPSRMSAGGMATPGP